MSRYLYAFDLSLSCTGMVIYDMDTMKPVVITSFPTPDHLTDGERLHILRSGIIKEGKPYPPSEVAKEKAFNSHNRASEAIYKVHGVIDELFFMYQMYEYTNSTVKLTVAGNGRATKPQVKRAIIANWPKIKFNEKASDGDMADAAAVGITHMVKKYGMKWDAPERTIKKTVKAKTTTGAKRRKKVTK